MVEEGPVYKLTESAIFIIPFTTVLLAVTHQVFLDAVTIMAAEITITTAVCFATI